MKQTAVEWLMEIDKSRAITIEEWQQAKEMEKEQIQNLNSRWAESREKTREIATRIGFNKGFESGLLHHDTYYEELIATKLDEDDFNKQYVSLVFDETFNTNEK